jgi:hypothetical protein
MPEVDKTRILAALERLAVPGQIVELRLLQVQLKGRQGSVTMSGYFDSAQALAGSAEEYADSATGAYITLNPVIPALLSRATNRIRTVGRDERLTSDADIVERRWLPIDLDPVRPSGISATDEEHDAAIERAYSIRQALSEDGWPKPIIADSGNGAHLLYRVDCPTDDDNLIKNCLLALAFRFDDEVVKIDRKVFNPSRIWKLYGTVSHKGDYSPARPHRLAKIIEVPR